MTEEDLLKNRIQEWLENNPDRGYALSENADKLISSIVKRKNAKGYKEYHCPCMIIRDEIDDDSIEYNKGIECRPCINVRDPELAKEGIEKNGSCHCNMIIKKD